MLLKSKEEFHGNLCIERASGTVAPDFSTACAAKASSGQSRTSDRGKVLCLSVSIRLVGRSVCVCVCVRCVCVCVCLVATQSQSL